MRSSHSEIESFTKCQRRHFYGYGLNLASLHSSDALYIGNCGHAGLEFYYKHLQENPGDFDGALEEAVHAAKLEGRQHTPYDTGLDLPISLLLCKYDANWRKTDESLEILHIERAMDITIIKEPNSMEYVMPVRIDLIVRDHAHNGKIQFWDHKFTSRFFSEKAIAMLPQLPRYLAAGRMSGYPVDQAVYNEVLTITSKAAKEDPSLLFRRTVLPISTARAKNTMRDQILVASQIAKYKEMGLVEWERRVQRSPSSECGYCPFFDVCDNDLNGQDRSLLISTQYTQRKVIPDAIVPAPVSDN